MKDQLELPDPPRFNGADYVAWRDNERLGAQIKRVYDVMRDGHFRTLRDIEREIRNRFSVNDPQASISAQLRHLRKVRFGGHTVERLHLGNGLYSYRLVA